MIYAFKSAPATDEFCWCIGTSGGPIANIQLKKAAGLVVGGAAVSSDKRYKLDEQQ